jgi:rSAM/selenodomain-associated transferase 1
MSLGVPYGDQALFVRRSTFEAIGGFADLPLMEDVDLVRRLKRCGTLLHSPLPVSTSARRWEHDGWGRRTAQNWRLASSYVLGVPPAALARRYLGRRRIAVAVMARAPWLPGKTRLAAAGLTAEDHADLRGHLFDDTVDAMKRVAGVDRYVACEPADACEALRARVGEGIDVIAQHGGDLGSRMHGTAADLFRLGAAGAILIGSDLPDLPTDVIADAARALDRRGDRLVLGPAGDGGYYLVGVKAPHPELFDSLDWGTGTVFDQTLKRARAAGVDVHLVSSWRDVDRWEDLLRLQTAETIGAIRTRSWLWSRREVS